MLAALARRKRGADPFIATAWRRWFLDRHAEFWLGELGIMWSPTEMRARVVEIIDETDDTRSFVLAPDRRWPGHRAGQFVPIEVEIDGVRVRRCYSISSGASQPRARRITITVKRVPGGRVSTWLHEQLCPGDVIGLGQPGGDFVVAHAGDASLGQPGGDFVEHPRASLGQPGGDFVEHPRARLGQLGGDFVEHPRASLGQPGGDFVEHPRASLGQLAGDLIVEHSGRASLGETVSKVVARRGVPLLLVAGGSGITPIMAIVRDLEARGELRDVVVVQAAQTDADAIFGRELATIAKQHATGNTTPDRDVTHGAVMPQQRAPARRPAGLSLRVIAHRDATHGLLDADKLRALVPDLGTRTVYVCGPAGLLDLVTEVASAAGATVHHERFVAARPAPANGPAQPVTIQLRNRSVAVDGAGSLLAQLERVGERPAHGCRMGICNSCRCRKQSGTVEDLVTGAISSEPDQEIRLCVSVARSDLDLAL